MILIIDDMPIFREPIAACLKLEGYDTQCAGDGKEGLEMARKRTPDLILLDMAMPGMDGIQVLQKLRGEPSTATVPVLMLTAVADRERVVQAIQYGAREYMLKSRFSTRELVTRIQKYLAPPGPGSVTSESKDGGTTSSEAQTHTSEAKSEIDAGSNQPIEPILNSKRCIRRIREATSGKTLSGVVTHVISIAASPRGDSTELAKLVSSDPILTARVLGVANSAAYASNSGLCTTVVDAVRKIGFSGVRNITAAVGIFDSMPASATNGFSPIRYWQHSMAVAQLCESLVRPELKGAVSPGHAYISGLCHDLGEILVRCEFDKEYRQVAEAAKRSGRSREEIQEKMLGISHADLVLEALRAIRLPEDIREPIENFHAGKNDPATTGPLPGILRIADGYANGLFLTADPDSKIESFDAAYVRSVIGTDKFNLPDSATLCSQVRSLTITMARLDSKEQDQLNTPLFAKTSKKRVWLARDSYFSDCDPLYGALSQMAEVSVHPELPTPADRASYDYLVIAARNATHKAFSEQAIAQSLEGTEKDRPEILWMVADAEEIKCSPGFTPVEMPIALRGVASFLGCV